MTKIDLNLLITLNVLLEECSVARAAERIKLSPSAMSRSLARLRKITGDPLLVRAGRSLIPSPRAIEIREQVNQLVQGAEAVLRPVEKLDLLNLERTFTIRTSDGFVENFGSQLIERIRSQAPKVRLRFIPKLTKESTLLREGSVDLETGVEGAKTSPEVRMRTLFTDHFVGVVHLNHPLSEGEVTLSRYASEDHVLVSKQGGDRGPVDDVLGSLGLERNIATLVGGYSASLAIAKACDMVATVPERHTGNLRAGMFTFVLPFDMPEIPVSMFWHPRMDGDQAHKWLRECVRDVCCTTSEKVIMDGYE